MSTSMQNRLFPHKFPYTKMICTKCTLGSHFTFSRRDTPFYFVAITQRIRNARIYLIQSHAKTGLRSRKTSRTFRDVCLQIKITHRRNFQGYECQSLTHVPKYATVYVFFLVVEYVFGNVLELTMCWRE